MSIIVSSPYFPVFGLFFWTLVLALKSPHIMTSLLLPIFLRLLLTCPVTHPLFRRLGRMWEHIRNKEICSFPFSWALVYFLLCFGVYYQFFMHGYYDSCLFSATFWYITELYKLAYIFVSFVSFVSIKFFLDFYWHFMRVPKCKGKNLFPEFWR